jgi:CRP-like cAMP-binding protein
VRDGKLDCVRVLSTEDHFGELALINDAKRSLGVRVISEECKLLKLDRETFTRILGDIDKHLKKDYGPLKVTEAKKEEKKIEVSPDPI